MPVVPVLTFLPLSATLIAGAFAIVLLNRYFATRRRPHELMWGIAFFLFAVGAGCQVFADIGNGWTSPVARTYYLTGAILNVALLALGTIYLLWPRRAAHWVLGVVLILAIYSAFVVYTVPVSTSALAAHSEVDWKALFSVDMTPRWLAAIASGVGSVVVIAGALWSALVFWRKRIMKHRMIGVLLIAAGTLLVGIGGTIKGAFHSDDYLYPTMVVGVTVMFAGYLQTIRPETRQSGATTLSPESSTRIQPAPRTVRPGR